MGLIDRVRKIEKSQKVNNNLYLPVLFLEADEDIEDYRKYIGPDTAIIRNDIPRECTVNES